jgi:hypothetical protein
MDALVRRSWGRAIAMLLTIALTTAAGISLAPAAQAAGTSVTASDAVATTGDAVPTITFTADYILTTAPTCAVYDAADTAFATPLTGAMVAGTYEKGYVNIPFLFIFTMLNKLIKSNKQTL